MWRPTNPPPPRTATVVISMGGFYSYNFRLRCCVASGGIAERYLGVEPAGADDAHALRERLRLLAEGTGVIRRIGHHLLHVIARLAERYGFGIDRRVHRGLGAPGARPAGPGVVGGGGQHR